MAGRRMNFTMDGGGPWGFRLAGGRDFNTPLYISKITPGGKANRANILENDTILAINGVDVKTVTHLEAQNLIKNAGPRLSVSIERGQAITWRPEVSHQEDRGFDVSLKANKQQFQHAGSSHNVKAKPFPGAGAPAPSATVVHKQFNSPVGIYSPSNIAETFKGQTEGISPSAGMDEPPPPPPAWQQPSSYVSGQPVAEGRAYANPGAQSRTFKMIQQLSTEDDADFPPPPPEVSKPSGMRSVKAPVAKPISGGAKPASALPVCHKCNRDITGPFVKVRGNPLHDMCFSCEACGLQLRNKGFFVIEDKLYCEDDKNRYYQQRSPGQMNGSAGKVPPPPPAKPPSHVAQADRSKGFSLDYSKPAGQPMSPPAPPPPAPAQSQYSWKPQAPAAPRAPNPPMATRPSALRVNMPPAARQRPGAPPVRQPGPPSPVGRPGVAPGSQRGGAGPLAPGTRTAYCDSCNDPIRGTFVTAFGRNWHPEHFVCAHCHKNLQGQGLIEEKGKIYCEDDYLQLYAPKCTKCRRAITGECVKAMGAEYHPACFTCNVCNQPITGEGFHIIDGQMYCKRDYQAKFKSVKCCGCNYPIESGEAWLEALDKSYHAECFTCSQCNQRLEGQRFYAKAGRPYCQVHGS